MRFIVSSNRETACLFILRKKAGIFFCGTEQVGGKEMEKYRKQLNDEKVRRCAKITKNDTENLTF